jgi:pantothenate kinase
VVELRRLIGITGAPGAGKSTYAARLAERLAPAAVVVPMDGFHLAGCELARLGRADRKGAPDTFDVDGYVQLLDRLRWATSTVYAPEFRRDLEEPIAGAIAVEPHHTTVITEGNYLLFDCDGWERVRPLLTECWFVGCDESERIARLVARHVAHGRSPEAARRWVEHTDEPNARLIEATRPRADRVVHVDDVWVDHVWVDDVGG